MQNPELILMLPVLLFSLSLHEFAHALVAQWAGDDTAVRAGRLTLNPLSHIDPVGTVLVPLLCLMQSLSGGVGFFFGWAKPVPVNPNRFKKLVWDVYVSGAGPLANFLLAVIFILIFKALLMLDIMTSDRLSPEMIRVLSALIINFIVLNVILGLFNLIPIPPLDGSHIFFHFFVRSRTRDNIMFMVFKFLERFGFLILMILLFAVPHELNPFYLMFGKVMQVIDWFLTL
jgi:Zn-dependent protease